MIILEKTKLTRPGNLSDDIHGIIIAEVNEKTVVFLVQLPENHGISTVNAFEEIASIVKNHYNKLSDNTEFYQVVHIESIYEWQISKVSMELSKDKEGKSVYEHPGWEDVVRYKYYKGSMETVDNFKEYPGYENFLKKDDIINFKKWWGYK